MLKAVEGLIEFVEGDGWSGGETEGIVEGEFVSVAAAFEGVLGAGVVNEDAAHELGGDAEEMSTALPSDTGLVDELHVCFVDEGGGLKGVIGAFAAHVVGCDFP